MIYIDFPGLQKEIFKPNKPMNPIIRIFLITLQLLLSSLININLCQQLEGIVLNEYGKPIAGASVYFNATTIGTITYPNGIFLLKFEDKINSPLIISFIGYKSSVISNPFEISYHEIRLIPDTIRLNEVIINTIKLSREKKLKLFREQFLGTSRGGESCIIENENDLILNYDNKSGFLFASCERPIYIVNPYLGYRITFTLDSFYIKFNRQKINKWNIIISYFSGTTLFQDISNNNKRVFLRRKDSYSGSQLHFFRSLSGKSLEKENFQLYLGKIAVNPEDCFYISDTLGLKKIKVLKNLSEDANEPFFCYFNILFKKYEKSRIIFRTDTFYIDRFGNNSSADLMLFSGAIAGKRVGDFLPLDYDFMNPMIPK